MTSSTLTIGLTGRGAYTSTNVSGSPAIGALTSHSLTDADVGYALHITAAAASNVATLTLTSGDVAQTTGSPVILGSGVDFEGNDLGTMTKVHAIRIRASGTGTVTVAGSNAAVPDVVLSAGADIAVKFPSGLTTPGTIALTFSATGGIAQIEVMAE